MTTRPPRGSAHRTPAARRVSAAGLLAAGLLAAASGAIGCQAFHPLRGVPAETLSDAFRTPVRTPRRPIDLSLLGQPRPGVYRLDTGDVLGIYAEALYGEAGLEAAPPVVTETTLNLIPGQGAPHRVGRDGTIHLPFLGPVFVRGLTLEEARGRLIDLTREEFEIAEEKDDPVVLLSLLRERTISVVVFRNELGPDGAVDNNTVGQGGARFDEPTGEVVELRAYENDVLHALAETGGPPNLEGDAVVTVTRAGGLRLTGCGPGGACGPAGVPTGPPGGLGGGAIGGHSVGPAGPAALAAPPTIDGPQVVKIPLQLLPGQPPGFCHADVILRDGDAVYVGGRTKEVFYTGGLLGPGSFRLPRDSDLDVLEALAVVQGQRPLVGTTRALTGNSALSRDVTAGASSLLILRERPDGTRLRIEVDLRDALVDARQRVLIRPQDYLILQYRKGEAVAAFFERFFVEGLVLGIASGLTFGN